MCQGPGNYPILPKLTLESQRNLHESTVGVTEQTMKLIVADLIAGGQHPMQAKLNAPYIFHTRNIG